MKRSILLCLILIALALSACAGQATPEGPKTVRLMSHSSFAISDDVLKQFQEEHNITVEFFEAGDAGEALNKAILAKDDPLADVFFGLDNTFLSRALENDIFIAYESPELSKIDPSLRLDPENHALPVDFGDVCLNYDIAWFQENNLEPPQNLADLTEPAYQSLLVVENPATSSPGLAFLMATIDQFGEDAYLDFWQNLRENDVLVANGWEEAYYSHFSAASDGDRPIVVSYASSPPAEVIFADPPTDTAPTAAVVSPKSCFRQIEFVGILQNSPNQAEAKLLIDFLLSVPFQEDVPMQMFVYPANTEAQLPIEFVSHSQIPDQPASLDPETIATQRETWISAWTAVVLQ